MRSTTAHSPLPARIPDLKPLSAQQIELTQAPSIASQLPIKFDNDSSWDTIAGQCSMCEQDIPDEHLRGNISRPFDNVAVMDAVGWCGECQAWTPFHYRIHNDLAVTGLGRDGKWGRWEPPPPDAWQRAKTFLQKVLRGQTNGKSRPGPRL
jgi:hypothetical protein